MKNFPGTNSIRMCELLNAGTERNLVSMFAWNVLWPYPNTPTHTHMEQAQSISSDGLWARRGERVAVLWALLLGVLERSPCRYTLSRKHCAAPQKHGPDRWLVSRAHGKMSRGKKQLGRKLAAETIFPSHNFAIIITSAVGTYLQRTCVGNAEKNGEPSEKKIVVFESFSRLLPKTRANKID